MFITEQIKLELTALCLAMVYMREGIDADIQPCGLMPSFRSSLMIYGGYAKIWYNVGRDTRIQSVKIPDGLEII